MCLWLQVVHVSAYAFAQRLRRNISSHSANISETFPIFRVSEKHFCRYSKLRVTIQTKYFVSAIATAAISYRCSFGRGRNDWRLLRCRYFSVQTTDRSCNSDGPPRCASKSRSPRTCRYRYTPAGSRRGCWLRWPAVRRRRLYSHVQSSISFLKYATGHVNSKSTTALLGGSHIIYTEEKMNN